MAESIQISREDFPWHDPTALGYPLGTQRNRTVFVSGQTAATSTGSTDGLSCSGDIVEQTQAAWEKIEVVLEAAGLGCENLVRTVDYVSTDALADYKETGAVRSEHLQGSPVAATGVFVEGFVERGALIKISAVAVGGAKEAIYPKGPEFDRYERLTYAPAVRTGPIVWLSGATGFQRDASGAKLYSPDFVTQVDQTYSFLDEVLGHAGASAADVVSRLEYLAPPALPEYAPGSPSRASPLRDLRATLTAVGVNRLLSTQRQIEVELTAATGRDREQTIISRRKPWYELTNDVLAARAGNLIFLSGQSPQHPFNEEPLETGGGLATQARNAYGNLAEVCRTVGIEMEAILHATEFIVPQAHHGFHQLDAVRRDFFGDELPAVTTVLAHSLTHPKLLFEVVAIAGS